MVCEYLVRGEKNSRFRKSEIGISFSVDVHETFTGKIRIETITHDTNRRPP
jgi:hypothetical protein